MADHRLTVREIAEEVGVSKDSAHAILREDLNMNRMAAKFVPKLLSPEQKDLRFDVAQDLLDTANTDPGFLNTMITGDESWVYGGKKPVIEKSFFNGRRISTYGKQLFLNFNKKVES
ncbi:HTH_48 domain-containing protein [Nephila pilipes]|uniref:HTH_48 domain-containing protein n=1 Tax=Nephila pilipes TaxID=299642 RepID=A0A8X6U7T8_NEPPI|nr:HTH_48 domain-containing protein [Nephila pilipes]